MENGFADTLEGVVTTLGDHLSLLDPRSICSCRWNSRYWPILGSICGSRDSVNEEGPQIWIRFICWIYRVQRVVVCRNNTKNMIDCRQEVRGPTCSNIHGEVEFGFSGVIG
jgi:hypothetical protein